MENEKQEIIFKGATLSEKKFNDADSSVESFITAETMDRDKDIVHRDGISIKRYKENPVVLFNHNYDKIVGKNTRLTKKTMENGSKALHGVTKFAPTEFGQELYQLSKDGFLNAWSIGFIPTEFETRSDEKGVGWNIYKSELLEYSAVSVPSNPDALTQRKLYNALKDYSENTQKEFTGGLDLNNADELADLRQELMEIKGDLQMLGKAYARSLAIQKLDKALADGRVISPEQIKQEIKKETGYVY